MVRWQSLSCEPHKCVERKGMVTLQSCETPTQCGSLSASCILVDQVVAKKHITLYSHEKPEYKASYVSFMNIYTVSWYSHTSIPVQKKLEQSISSLLRGVACVTKSSLVLFTSGRFLLIKQKMHQLQRDLPVHHYMVPRSLGVSLPTFLSCGWWCPPLSWQHWLLWWSSLRGERVLDLRPLSLI